MSTLDVTIVQADLYWHETGRNLEQFSGIIGGLTAPTDLIVLPEMFTSGFTMDAPACAEPMDGPSMAWLADRAAESSAAVCGSLIIVEDGKFFNRFVMMFPDGNFSCYDKRHLFRLADEHHHYSAGRRQETIEWRDFRIRPMVCYDLRFPVWSRNRDDYDLLIYVANWPSRRHFAWETLLRARAIENLAFVAGINRSGTDGNNIPYAGGSAVVDYLGADLAVLGEDAGTASATLDLTALRKFRDRFPFHVDADGFSIDRTIPT